MNTYIVDSQCVGPAQLGFDYYANVRAVHRSLADMWSFAPIRPEHQTTVNRKYHVYLYGYLDVEGESQNLRLINHHFTTVSSHFFAISINIFHKTEILTVILRCCMDLYLNWFSSYGPKRENFRFRFLLIL